jgi:hypothetical protein
LAKPPRIPEKLKKWIEARQRHRLSHAQIQMARELGMNPKKFGKLDNHDQERWKLPLGEFIEKCYRKRFGRLPATVLSIEQWARREEKKRAARRKTKAAKRQAEAAEHGGQGAQDGVLANDAGPPQEDVIPF